MSRALASLMLLLLACSAGCRAPTPRAVREVKPPVDAYPGFVESEVDLGVLHWYERRPFVLQFVNPLDRPVTISAVATSCGCTEVNESAFAGRTLGPGESVTIDGRVVAGAAPRGHTEEVSVLLAGGLVRTARIRFAVVAGYFVRPKQLNFGFVTYNPVTGDAQPVSSTRRIIFESSRRHVTGIDWDVPWVTASDHTIAPGRTEIVVHLLPEYLDARYNEGHVLIRTDDPARPVVSVRVQAENLLPLTPVPRWVYLRPGQNQCVFVIDDSGNRVPIVRAEPGRDDLRVVIRQDGSADVRWEGRTEHPARTRVRLVLPGDRAVGLGVHLLPDGAPKEGDDNDRESNAVDL